MKDFKAEFKEFIGKDRDITAADVKEQVKNLVELADAISDLQGTFNWMSTCLAQGHRWDRLGTDKPVRVGDKLLQPTLGNNSRIEIKSHPCVDLDDI